ncbi:hypothetical protein ACQ4PT_027204 [Festuca glaucescens]
MADLEKGKMVISQAGFQPNKGTSIGEKKVWQQWTPPARGLLKLNVDGSYANDNSAGAGIVIRDQTGAVILTACWQLQHCIDATEAEVAAMELGIAQAMNVTFDSFVLESDCVEAIALIKEGTPNMTKIQGLTQVWLQNFPQEVAVALDSDFQFQLGWRSNLYIPNKDAELLPPASIFTDQEPSLAAHDDATTAAAD